MFYDDFDYLEYLRVLHKEAQANGCAIHAYVLMTNHVHLLTTPQQNHSLAHLFQGVGRHYVRYINTTYQRSGALWEGRYKCHLIDSQTYLLACMRYIEMNPVRAGMVGRPDEYRWSSYAANALGQSNAILAPHGEYLDLGSDPEQRLLAYRSLFDLRQDAGTLDHFRAALQSGTPLVNQRFRREIESVPGRRIGEFRRGRPGSDKKGV